MRLLQDLFYRSGFWIMSYISQFFARPISIHQIEYLLPLKKTEWDFLLIDKKGKIGQAFLWPYCALLEIFLPNLIKQFVVRATLPAAYQTLASQGANSEIVN